MNSSATHGRPRVAVVGAGIAGLGAARRLGEHCAVTLFEADTTAGGHARTVDATVDGVTHPVDVGFLVFNERTYPRLIGMFSALGVETVGSDMSFSVSVGPHAFEWCGSDLATLFAQPSNALRPRFWRMLADIVRFNREATALARTAPDQGTGPTLGEFLEAGRYGEGLRDDYLLPMAAAIWSCPVDTMLAFPAASFARFCDNHGLLQVVDRPRWFTVAGGSRRYVDAVLGELAGNGGAVRLASPVLRVRREAGGVLVTSRHGTERFDAVVLAAHARQSLAMLDAPLATEASLLGAQRTQPNRAVLHLDTAAMPQRRRAWAAWNYLSDGASDRSSTRVSVTYWLQRLQPLPFRRPLFVSLNPLREPDPATVLAEFDFAHPVFDADAIDAQLRLETIQGAGGVWYAGAWSGYGFHEDGLRAGEQAADGLLAALATPLGRLAA